MSLANVKRGTGYCKKKDVNLLKSDCENCKEAEIIPLFTKNTFNPTNKNKEEI